MDNNFRMEALTEMEQYLRDEIRTRTVLKRKYSYFKNFANVLNYTLLIVSFAVGTTGVLMGPGMILSGVASTLAILNIIFPAVIKKMQSKSDKHYEVQNLAEEKLNTVYSHISKAIDDNFISESEFSQIHDDIESYRHLKEAILLKYSSQKIQGLMESLTKHLEKESLKKISENID